MCEAFVENIEIRYVLSSYVVLSCHIYVSLIKVPIFAIFFVKNIFFSFSVYKIGRRVHIFHMANDSISSIHNFLCCSYMVHISFLNKLNLLATQRMSYFVNNYIIIQSKSFMNQQKYNLEH